MFDNPDRTSPVRSRQKRAQGWEEAGFESVVTGNPPLEWLTWLGGVELESGRESNYQSESGSRTPVIVVFVELLKWEPGGTLEKQIELYSSPVPWQTEGPTTRSDSLGVTGEHPQQAGELRAKLIGKDTTLTEK